MALCSSAAVVGIFQPSFQKVALEDSRDVGKKNLVDARSVGGGEQDEEQIDILPRDG